MPQAGKKKAKTTATERGLTNKQQAFIEEYLVDLNGTQAAIRAGYSKDTASVIAHENLTKPRIAEAIDKALEERAGVTRPRIVTELARIGFADIRKAVDWRSNLVREQDNPDGGDVLVIKEVFSNHVRLIDSDQIDEDTAAAISEVRQSPTGGLSIKFHDKTAALEKLGRVLNLFKERVEVTGKDGAPITPTIILSGRPESASAPKAVGSVRDGSDGNPVRRGGRGR